MSSTTTRNAVKNRAPAHIQISNEQLIREANAHVLSQPLDPITQIHDKEEYQSYLASRRKHFEDNIRYRREHIGNWVKYARFEEDNKEFERSRSVFERSLEVDHRSAELWLRYAEMEMRNEFVNRARNVLDRAVQILPRVDFLWYKYAFMEETVGNVDLCREVFERWMEWCPEDGVWLSYARFEVRVARANGEGLERATEVMKRYVNEYPCAKSFLKLAKWAEHEGKDMELARKVYEGALVELDTEEVRQARVFRQFALFEERQGEFERARVIYRHAIKLLNLEEKIEEEEDDEGETKNNKDVTVLSLYSDTNQTKSKHSQKPNGTITSSTVPTPTLTKQLQDPNLTDNERQRRDELYRAYVAFEKKHGSPSDVDSLILTRQRRSYQKKTAANPLDYDAWFEYAKLEEDHGDATSVRDVYERAVGNVPPSMTEKRFWKRYIFLWIYYAVYEEMEAGDLERASLVYEACLKLIPHKDFSFAKVWIYAAKLYVRRKELGLARKTLGRAIGMCGKEKIFVEYIALELMLGEVGRCRTLYNNYLKAMPHNCRAWAKYADLERSVGETDRCRALYELAVSQPALDMPEILWKGYIDFEIEEGEGDNARALYERLLERTGHVKVWISYAQFEGTDLGHGVKDARAVFDRAYTRLKEEGQEREEGENDVGSSNKEERVLLLDAWRVYEKAKGDAASLAAVEAKLPRRIKRKRMRRDKDTGAEIGWEEYFDYHFPEDEGGVASNNLKILDIAAKWKTQQNSLSDSDEDDDDMEEADSDSE